MTHRGNDRRGRWLGLAALAVGAGLAGCAGPNFWDDVTSRDYKFNSMFSKGPPPIQVLRDSTDGDARAKAMLAIKEPRGNGGNDAEQEEVVRILTTTAISDPQPLCRRSAITALGRFHDERAVPALIQSYETAGQLTADIAGPLQTITLTSLGQTKQPSAVNFLVQAAVKPTPAEASERDRQVARDNRLAAVRALQNFTGSAEVIAATGKLAETERDVAMRDRARETYVKVTGGKEPPAADATNAGESTATGGVQLTGARQGQ